MVGRLPDKHKMPPVRSTAYHQWWVIDERSQIGLLYRLGGGNVSREGVRPMANRTLAWFLGRVCNAITEIIISKAALWLWAGAGLSGMAAITLGVAGATASAVLFGVAALLLAAYGFALHGRTQRSGQRVVTKEQRAILKATMQISVPVFYNQLNPESEHYARDLAEALGAGVPMAASDVSNDMEGLLVGFQGQSTVPELAEQLSGALTKAGIQNRIEFRKLIAGLPPGGTFYLAVGRNA